MPKTGMEAVRRAAAMDATLECICETGEITLDLVAAKAGFSKGILAYYFQTKEHLLLESFRAFLSSYRRKIAAAAAGETDPLAMVKRVAAVALPPLDEEKGKAIRVTGADEEIALPQEKIAKLFIHFVAKAAVDERYRALAREAYALDTKGIAALLAYKGVLCDENKDAYGLLAMIYGLSFFRVMDFLPSGERDNREIAFDYIERLLMGAGNVEREARI